MAKLYSPTNEDKVPVHENNVTFLLVNIEALDKSHFEGQNIQNAKAFAQRCPTENIVSYYIIIYLSLSDA